MSCCAGCDREDYSVCAGCGLTGCQRYIVRYNVQRKKSYCNRCSDAQDSKDRLDYYIRRNKELKQKLRDHDIKYEHSDDSYSEDTLSPESQRKFEQENCHPQ